MLGGVQQFKSTWPFTEHALLALARMSRGVFRRYLRYIILSLDLWENRTEGSWEIDSSLVSEAVPLERICEDMALELAQLFPKHSELREQAARLLIRLGERGDWKQTELAKDLDMEPYALSRILAKLEIQRYVNRKRDGKDKIVSLTTSTSQLPDKKQCESIGSIRKANQKALI
jgi:DNA-binding MarR family transcriptional regulator